MQVKSLVMLLLAQTNLDKPVAQWYGGVVAIMAIGLGAIALLLLIFMTRRWARRQRRAIEKERNERRQSHGEERIDAWSTSAQRYVDHDKLPDEVPYDAEDDEDFGDDEEDWPDAQAGQGTQDDTPDPYGLFDDKPYRDTDDDEDEDEEDEDEEEDDGPQGPGR